MTDFGVVSDIHGNFEALQKVWRIFEDEGLTRRIVLNAGDSVAYGTQSQECIEFLQSKPNIINVCGNYDTGVLKFPEKADDYSRKWERSRPEKFEAIRSASDSISEEGREWLRSLPALQELDIEGKYVSLSHYVPNSSKEGLGKWTILSRFEEIARGLPYDIIVTGHTHSPFVRTFGGTLFINPGSVGRGWSGIFFAVLTVQDTGAVSAEIRQCPK